MLGTTCSPPGLQDRGAAQRKDDLMKTIRCTWPLRTAALGLAATVVWPPSANAGHGGHGGGHGGGAHHSGGYRGAWRGGRSTAYYTGYHHAGVVGRAYYPRHGGYYGAHYYG